MKFKFFYIAFTVFFLSCGTINNNSSYKLTKSTEINNSGVYSLPVVADLKVQDTKVSATVQNRIASNTDRDQVVNNLKNLAISKAIDESKADVLIEPIFKIDFNDDLVEVTVTGRPGTYNNFRNMKSTDTAVLKLNQVSKVENKYASTKTSNVKNRTNLLIIPAVVLFIWVLLVLSK